MERRTPPVMNVGITLIVLIFMNVCLITFSMLSLQNAVADKRLTQKTADYTTAYYEAVSEVEVQWKEADALLTSIAKDSKNSTDFYKKLENTLQNDTYHYTIEKEKNNYYLLCSEPVLDHQRLYGRAKILWHKQKEIELSERQSYLDDNGSWEADRKIKVLK